MHLFPNLIVLQLMISKLSSGLIAESRWSELSQNIKIIQMLGEEINCFCNAIGKHMGSKTSPLPATSIMSGP